MAANRTYNFKKPRLTCKRCGHDWKPKTLETPRSCPRCKSYKWDERTR